jgi:hypothetical protein
MSMHKFKVGQLVHFNPGRSAMSASSREYKVVRLLPAEDSEFTYRIKSSAESFERVAREGQLVRRQT